MSRLWLSGLLALVCAAGCGDDEDDAETGGNNNGGANGNANDDGANGAANNGNNAGNNGDTEDAGASCTNQMYDKYKQAGFEAVNTNILTNVGTVSAMNPSPIGDSFKGLTPDQVEAVEANLLDFLVFVYGGPNNYEGKSMKESHATLEITQAQYDAFIGMVVVPALASAGVPEADITNCFAPPVLDPAFVADIVTK